MINSDVSYADIFFISLFFIASRITFSNIFCQELMQFCKAFKISSSILDSSKIKFPKGHPLSKFSFLLSSISSKAFNLLPSISSKLAYFFKEFGQILSFIIAITKSFFELK